MAFMYQIFLLLIFSNLFNPQNSLAQANEANTSDIIYPSVDSQVTFKAVTELPTRQPDIKIAYGIDPLQYGQLWIPQEKTHKSLIILIHGGCWLNAFGVDHSFPMATELSQAGHPVWSLEYRRIGDTGGGWPGSYEDIKLALMSLSKLQANGIKTDQPILMGHSAGGHLALLAASELSTIKFKKIIGLAAITDVSRYALGQNSCQQATQKFMAGLPHEQADAYHEANLIYRQPIEKTLLLYGGSDEIVPAIQAQLDQVPNQLIPKAGHFDWIHPGSEAFQKLLKVLQQ